MKQVAAFFDLDGTLIDVNSARLWAELERREGRIGRLAMVRVSLWLGLYYLSLVDLETAYEKAVRHYSGTSAADLDRRIGVWFREEIVDRLRPGARRSLDWHRSVGHRLVLLTSVSDFEAAYAAEAFGFEAGLASHFLRDSRGRLTGEVERPLCYAAGKLAHAERWAAQNDIDLDESWFYTDSYTDLPMLERVGEPRVVAPDLRLARAARKRGWKVMDW